MRSKKLGEIVAAFNPQSDAPKLRFPEFEACGSWKTLRLGEVLSFQAGFPFDSAKFSEQISGLRLIRNRDLKSNDKAIFYAGEFDGRYVVENGDVLIGMDGEFMPHVWKAGRALLNQRVGRIIAGAESSLEFAYYFLSVHLKSIEESTAKTTVKHLSHSTVEDIEELLPTLAEQQKIGGFLFSLDACIGAEIRKLRSLKAHKQGLMQQLFPAESQRLPRLRFPGFEGEWEPCELGGKTSKVGSGVTPTGGQQVYKTSGRPFVRSQNVGWGELLLDDIAFINDVTHASFASTELIDQDVLLNITGASIGRSAIADERVSGGNVNQHVCIIRPIGGSLDPAFLNQFLISQLGQDQIDSFQAGGNRQGLNFAQIRSLMISLPPTFIEQQRVSACLSSFDISIAARCRKIAALQQHKKGLMQGLFPPLDAHAA